ncbi:Glycosyltransferase involved in cell wall bisynthesis [Pricia antarctica]|uniref:Glycosyltransferase involved in cell wall bisynthesis n=1 Tax=Pricia antarctica TaxID=641691 RepID=A0A1G6ZWN2_9FLAO|nr:glycosyltransferase [Pricia antarctica]SDE06036.1 Glycosyltransferase involved in cell wall bisynthesis [Pricia antarctica]
MKTICFFNSTEAWGGGEKWHLEASGHLHALGYPVLVIAHIRGELYNRLLDSDIQCLGIRVTNLSFLNLLKLKSIEKILERHNVGTIVMNLSRDLKLAGLASKWAGIERIIYRRGSAIPIKNSWLNRYYFKTVVSEVLANSHATKKTVLVNNPNLFPEDKIKVIYNGIEIDTFVRKATRPSYQKKDADELVLSNLGRLELQKNQKFLIDLAAELKRRKLKFKMLIGGEGSLRDELLSRVKKLQVEQQVVFAGFIENPKDLICSGDIFVLPSLWEGFGYVLAEAALCKKPIIAFDCSSNPEVVVDGSTGFLTPVDNVEAFADKVQYLAEHPKQRQEMGQKGFAFARENFDNGIIQEKIVNYLVHGR